MRRASWSPGRNHGASGSSGRLRAAMKAERDHLQQYDRIGDERHQGGCQWQGWGSHPRK